ncbi:MAG: aminoacyl-tRNA hydrolase [Deltaproteobacteria bacterium]|nr:aminoacyl-tRNA hydrolase [Candidatus Zymogenaceae bacterium]
MKAVFGLGNPGDTYANTRHNIGFFVVDALAELVGVRLSKKKFSAKTGEIHIGGERVFVAKPQTFMNISGRSVAQAAGFFRLEASDIIVVYDDMDLDFGKLRIRPGGGAGGHRGVKSIIDQLGDADFTRVRIGIGRPEGSDGSAVGHVLGAFSKGERAGLDEIIDRAVDAVRTIIISGTNVAMNQYNG